jgi:hypothetical protein
MIGRSVIVGPSRGMSVARRIPNPYAGGEAGREAYEEAEEAIRESEERRHLKPGPKDSKIDVRDTQINVGGIPNWIRHTFIVHHDGTSGDEFAYRGGNTKGKSVCPGVGLKPGPPLWTHLLDPISAVNLSNLFSGKSPELCPYNDPSLGAIGVGPLQEPFKPGATDWPALDSQTLLQGPDADTKDACFKSEAARISAKCIPYSPCGPNSNSVTFTLLTNCGIAATAPGGALYPGWGILI